MKTIDSAAWSLPSKAAFDKLLKVLAPEFGFRHKPGKVKRIEVLDNFDWDLWHGGVSLAKASAREYLLFADGRELSETGVKTPARFWWDFPEGECRIVLKEKSPLRALLPIANVRFAVHQYELLNDDDKVVVRLKLIQHYSAESQQSRKIIGVHLQAISLLGYEDCYRQTVALIEKSKFPSSPLPSLQQLLLAQGLEAKPKPSKKFDITSAMPAEAAIKLMGSKMLDLAVSQREGLLADIDTEFLHQYRVHLRKLRSLIALMKRCLLSSYQQKLKQWLAEVFAPTNRLRDLDVFLLDQSHYQTLLPAEFSAGLERLFAHISRERQQCQKALVRTIKAKTYQQNIKQIATMLADDPGFEGEQSQLPIKTLAKKRIVARYNKVCRLGQSITDHTPDAEVHQLRIECKKLRYLIEFFAELFPNKTIKTLVKGLKGLQDILGRFNDYSVQQQFLNRVAAKEKSKSVLAAIHGLIAVLHQQQRESRSSVCQAVEHFANPEMAATVASLSSKEKT